MPYSFQHFYLDGIDRTPSEVQVCPACGAISGDAWLQCHPGGCPMVQSPHYDARVHHMLGEPEVVKIAKSS